MEQPANGLAPTNIYVLKLANDCWYIGRAADVKRRVEHHFKRYGSAWTKLHRPISLEAIYRNASPFDEDRYTKEYMLRFGIDRVRGGTYSQPVLSKEQRKLIQQELWGAQDLCFLCGGKHFVKTCSKDSSRDTEQLIHNDAQQQKSVGCMWKACTYVYNTIVRCLQPSL